MDSGRIVIEDHYYALENWQSYDLWLACAEECEPPYEAFESGRVRWLRLDDMATDWSSPEGSSIAEGVIEAAKEAVRAYQTGKKVLITCHLGLNRSSLVAGTALIMLGLGFDNTEKEIRLARGPLALSNISFKKFLKLFDAEIRKMRHYQ